MLAGDVTVKKKKKGRKVSDWTNQKVTVDNLLALFIYRYVIKVWLKNCGCVKFFN